MIDIDDETLIDEICRRGCLRDGDVAALRRRVYSRPNIDAGNIELLFRINRTTRSHDAAWSAFFVEAVTDYLINDVVPQGYVTAANADWLIQRISKDGLVEARNELELLISVLERARWAPASLARFAMDQIRLATLNGAGPLRTGALLQPGQISECEVDLLRRVLYAFGADGNVAVTRAEAEVLFDIEDATANQPQLPAWQDLFVKAVANVIMAASGYAVPAREEALRREQWLDTRNDLSIASFLTRVFKSYHEQSTEDRALARLERQRVEIITNEEVTETEAAWLAERIGRDGRVTANERLLLAFLKRESPRIHPVLQQLVDAVSIAA